MSSTLPLVPPIAEYMVGTSSHRIWVRRVAVVCACGVALLPSVAEAQVDRERAHAYFAEAAALCERDAGRLWGVPLCGPMVIADAATKTLATSQPPPDGPRPPTLGFVNAPIEWGGARWAAYVWSYVPTDDASARGRLLMHELFHRVQAGLGLMTVGQPNDHLDTLDGRYWLAAARVARARPGAGRVGPGACRRHQRRAGVPAEAAFAVPGGVGPRASRRDSRSACAVHGRRAVGCVCRRSRRNGRRAAPAIRPGAEVR